MAEETMNKNENDGITQFSIHIPSDSFFKIIEGLGSQRAAEIMGGIASESGRRVDELQRWIYDQLEQAEHEIRAKALLEE